MRMWHVTHVYTHGVMPRMVLCMCHACGLRVTRVDLQVVSDLYRNLIYLEIIIYVVTYVIKHIYVRAFLFLGLC